MNPMSPTPTEECEGGPERLVDYFAEIQDCIMSIQGALRHRQQPQDFHFHKAEKACRDGVDLIGKLWNRRPDPVRASVIEECARLVEDRLYDYRAHGSIDFPDNMPKELGHAIRALAPVGSAPLADTGGSMPSNPFSDPVRVELLAALKQAEAFIGIMFGEGPDAILPETVPCRLGVPLKLGKIASAIRAAIAKGEA